MYFSNLFLDGWADETDHEILWKSLFLIVTNGALSTVYCQRHTAAYSFPSPRSFPNTILLSEGRVCKSPVHLQRRHLHIRGLGILGASCRAVSSRSSHGTEARGGATHVGET